MEAKELMIGDWVKVPNDYEEPPFQIGSVSVDEVSQSKGAELTFAVSEIEPIHLTPEILIKNGWYYLDEEDGWLHSKLAANLYAPDESQKTWYLHILTDLENEFRLLYVHELQHVLRLCGLGEMADNFII